MNTENSSQTDAIDEPEETGFVVPNKFVISLETKNNEQHENNNGFCGYAKYTKTREDLRDEHLRSLPEPTNGIGYNVCAINCTKCEDGFAIAYLDIDTKNRGHARCFSCGHPILYTVSEKIEFFYSTGELRKYFQRYISSKGLDWAFTVEGIYSIKRSRRGLPF